MNTKLSAEEKENFVETAKAIGMTPSAVIKAFVHKFCEYGGMPFEMRREPKINFSNPNLIRAKNVDGKVIVPASWRDDDDDDDDCGCGHHHHDHGGEVHAGHKHIEGAVTQVFLVNNLGCAHCASKMEAKIGQMPEVASCTLTYATKQLRVEAAHPLELLPRIQQICASIESEVTVTPRAARSETKREAQEESGDEGKRDLVRIIVGAAALVIGKVLEHFLPATGVLHCNIAALLLFVVGYVYCGWGVLKQAAVNIAHGRALDENFLMSIATLGAFIIGDFAEAVGVMIFYRIGEAFEHKAVEKSRSNIMEALDLRPEVVNLMEGGEVRTIPAEDALPGDVVLVQIWKLKITDKGLHTAIFMAIRLIYLILGSSVMTLTTTPNDLTDGLEKLMSPLKKLHVPVHEVAMMMSIALRFIAILLEETDKIMKAQIARGADFENGNLIQKAKNLVPLLVPLFISAFRRANDLAMAMEARCYRGGEGRTKMKPLVYAKRDYYAYGVVALFMAAIIAVRVVL